MEEKDLCLNNKILSYCMKSKGVSGEDAARILKYSETLRTWKNIAADAWAFPAMNYQERKAAVTRSFDAETFRAAITDAYSFFSEEKTGTVKRELLHLYSAVSAVACANLGQALAHLPAIARALCEVLEYEDEQPQDNTLQIRLPQNGERPEGVYRYHLDTGVIDY